MKQIECLKSRLQIASLSKVNSNFVAYTNNDKNIKIIAPLQCKTIQSIYVDLLSKKTTALAFHKNSDTFAIANGAILYIINTTSQNIIQTIHTNDGNIQIITFVEDTPYIITGTDNGRVVQYRYDGKYGISRLCSFPYNNVHVKRVVQNNYVSAFAYNKEYLACSGHGGAVTIIKFNSHASKLTLETSNVKVTALEFLDENRIIYGNVNGNIFISKYKKHGATQTVHTMQTHIKQIILIPKSHYALISTQSTSLMLLDTANAKIIKNSFINFDDKVSQIVLLSPSELMVSLSNNHILKVSIGSIDDLKTLISSGSLLEAFTLIEANPMLENSEENTQIELLYSKLYSDTMQLLIKSKNLDVAKPIEKFKKLKNKKDDYQNLLRAYENYEKLQELYQNSKFALAYSLVDKYEALKFTQEYKEMEKIYKATFTLAQKHILTKHKEKAAEILAPFATVNSKRAMIKLLLRQNSEFLEFLKSLAEKNYEKINALIQTNDTFKDIPSYLTLMQSLQDNVQKIKELINRSQIDKATELIKELYHIPNIKDEIQSLYDLALNAKKLLKQYENNNFTQCYELIDEHRRLDSMQLSILLENHWSKKINQCELFALSGNIKGIKDTLGELILVRTRRGKIGDLLRVSFYSKAKDLLKKQQFKSAENIIYSYIDIFGMDSEIKQLMMDYESSSQKKLAITIKGKKHLPRDNWVNSDIMN